MLFRRPRHQIRVNRERDHNQNLIRGLLRQHFEQRGAFQRESSRESSPQRGRSTELPHQVLSEGLNGARREQPMSPKPGFRVEQNSRTHSESSSRLVNDPTPLDFSQRTQIYEPEKHWYFPFPRVAPLKLAFDVKE